MVTHIPEAQGFNAIINFVCMKSKDVISVKCWDNINLEGQVKLYIDNMYRLHRIFNHFFSDYRMIFIFSLEFLINLESKLTCLQHTILKQMDSWKECIRKYRITYEYSVLTDKLIGLNGSPLPNLHIVTKYTQLPDIPHSIQTTDIMHKLE